MSVSQVSGLLSGLDTAALIDALVTARSAPVFHLQRRMAEKTAELSAWQSFEAMLLGLKIETERLGNRDLWSALSVTASDDEHFTATADAQASTGSWSIFVEQLAVAHQVRSGSAFSGRDELVGSGTLSFTIDGSVTELSVTDGSTVSDLVAQINDADLGVSASLVRSETLGTETFHLVVTADETGVASQFTVDPSALVGGTALDFTLHAPRAGADAVIRLGGESGLSVHSSTNTFSDLFDGVDVVVRRTHTSGERTQLDITRDISRITDRITEFVDRFNAVMSFKNSQYAFDADIGDRPALMGSATLVSVTSQVRRALLGPIDGLADATFSTLAGVGLTVGPDGTLSFDPSRFRDLLDQDFDAVADLFRPSTTFDATGIEWLSAPDSVELGSRSIEVLISQAATRATVTGATIELGSGLVIDATNDTFQISLDGIRSEDVRIAHGTYTDGDALAAAIARAVERSENLGALSVRAAWLPGNGSSGQLELTSTKYGAAATITLLNAGTDFASDLGFASQMNLEASGLDVAGTIGGLTATGTGQVLKLDDDVPELGGLSFRVSLPAAELPARITARFTEGVGRSTTRTLVAITDEAVGTLARVESSIQATLRRYERDIAAKQEQLELRRARLEKQYAALEVTLGRLQGQSQLVAAQIDAMMVNRVRYPETGRP